VSGLALDGDRSANHIQKPAHDVVLRINWQHPTPPLRLFRRSPCHRPPALVHKHAVTVWIRQEDAHRRAARQAAKPPLAVADGFLGRLALAALVALAQSALHHGTRRARRVFIT